MNLYRLLADLTVFTHLAYVLFVLLGAAAIFVGRLRGWSWIRNFYFRAAHLAAIGFVAVEGAFHIQCPLTALEDFLRIKAGETITQGTFIGRLAHELVFLDVPQKTMDVVYVFFGLFVLLTIFLIPPRWPKKGK